MIAQIGLTVLLLWVIAYAWAEYRRAPLIGTVAVLVATAGLFSFGCLRTRVGSRRLSESVVALISSFTSGWSSA
jgi:uncharacterized membrane protein YqjE